MRTETRAKNCWKLKWTVARKYKNDVKSEQSFEFLKLPS